MGVEGEDVEVSGVGRGGCRGAGLGLGGEIKMRGVGAMGRDEVQVEKRGKSWELEKNQDGDGGRRGKDGELVKHYDADGTFGLVFIDGALLIRADSVDEGNRLLWDFSVSL
jgi:hypothetical protein